MGADEEFLNQDLISFLAGETGLDQARFTIAETLKLNEGFGSIFLKATIKSDEGTTYTVSGIKVTDDPGSGWEFCLESQE